MFMIYYYCLGFSIVKISIIVIFRGNNHEHPSSSSRVPYLGYHLPRHQSQVCHARRACTATPGGQVDLRPTPEHDWREMYPLVKKHSYGKSPFLMGKSAISMAIFNSKLLVCQRVCKTFKIWIQNGHPQRTQIPRDAYETLKSHCQSRLVGSFHQGRQGW